MNRLRKLGILGVLAAFACLGLALLGTNSASANRNGKVQLSVQGAAFSAHPVGPFVDTNRLAPGRGFHGLLGVRSRFGVATRLSLQLTDVRDDDNGCPPPEARIDATCGRGQGELARHLRVTVSAAAVPGGSYSRVWSGRASALERSATLHLRMPAKADRWLRISGEVPRNVGNIIETDTLHFGLQVVLAGSGVHGGSGVNGQRTHGGHRPASSWSSALADTGVATDLFVTGAALLVGFGALLIYAGRSRRASSGGSSTERREPRPTAPH